MGITTRGRSGCALLLANGGAPPDYCVLGTGSAAFAITDTDLNTPLHWAIFDSTGSATQKKVTYTTTYDSVTVSGTNTYKELGIFTSGTGAVNSLWSKEAFAGNAITANGEIEIQVQVTYEVY